MTQREVFHLTVHVLGITMSQCWARWEARNQELVPVLPQGIRALKSWAIFYCFYQSIIRELEQQEHQQAPIWVASIAGSSSIHYIYHRVGPRFAVVSSANCIIFVISWSVNIATFDISNFSAF